MKRLSIIVLLLLCLPASVGLSAQEAVSVPVIIGLNVPQAAAALNRAGLTLGNQTPVRWEAASGLPENTVGAQSLEAGASAAPGTPVDVTVLRTSNIVLVYDDNDLTLVNLSGAPVNIGGLIFTATEGASASFAASRWTGALAPGDCGQVWSISRGAAKDVAGCASTRWLTTNNPQEHFWTTANGVVRFSVIENGVERASCDAAPVGTQDQPLRCEAYVTAGGAASEITSYVYFTYTTDAFAVINRSLDKWMPTGQTTILNYNPNLSIAGLPVQVGDPGLFGNPPTPANIGQLAPGQCVLFTSDNASAAPPEPCDQIAQLHLASNVAFWLANFVVDSAADDERRECPAAVADRVTICVMPR